MTRTTTGTTNERTRSVGEIPSIHRRLILPEELVKVVKDAECPIGLGHTAYDEALPTILACLTDMTRAVPVKDVVYYRSVFPGDNKYFLLVHTDRGRLYVFRTKEGFRATYTNFTNTRLAGARNKLLEILVGGDSFPHADFTNKKVTVIGDLIGIDHFVFVALGHFFQSKGAKEVEFVGPRPELVHRRYHRHH